MKRRSIYGRNLLPKEAKQGLPSFIEVLQKVSDAYKDQREKIIEQKIDNQKFRPKKNLF